jgi:hypothetical protein
MTIEGSVLRRDASLRLRQTCSSTPGPACGEGVTEAQAALLKHARQIAIDDIEPTIWEASAPIPGDRAGGARSAPAIEEVFGSNEA